jgi:hypothetical protein
MKKLNEYSDNELQDIINLHNSMSAILRHINISETCPYNRKLLKERLKILDTSKYEENKKTDNPFFNGMYHKQSDEEYFSISDKRKSGSNTKTRLIKYKNFKDECSVCGLQPIWNGIPLSMHVDHINGNCFDNRLENLRLICPNCHSQTETFGSKNVIREEKITKYCECGRNISDSASKCQKCASKYERVHKIKWPSNEELSKFVWEKSLSKLGNELGISGNSIKKRCIKNKIVYPPIGYWSNLQFGNLEEAEKIKNQMLG